MPVQKLLIMLAEPRTGCSHFRQIIASSGVFHCRDELFHKSKGPSFSPDELLAFRELHGVNVLDQKAFASWRFSHIGETIDICFSNAGRPGLFKIVPSAYSRPELEFYFLNEPHFNFLVVRRRPIESYISRQKAKILQRWGHVDTTQLKPELQALPFIKWCETYAARQEWITQHAISHPNQFLYVDYEEFSDKSVDELIGWAFWSRLSEWLSVSLKPSLPNQIMKRQDLEPDYRKRVANWSAFADEMNTHSEYKIWFDWSQRLMDRPNSQIG